MEIDNIKEPYSMYRTGAICGLVSIFCYFSAAVITLPDTASRLMAIAFGPLLIIGYLGAYSWLKKIKHGPELQISYVFGIIAGASITMMLILQIANNMWHNEAIEIAKSENAKNIYTAALIGADRVQLGLDLVLDIFTTLSVILLGVCLIRNSITSKIIGVIGILIASLLLFLNMATFPNPPAESGLFDAGPFLGLWYMIFFIWLIILTFKKRKLKEQKT